MTMRLALRTAHFSPQVCCATSFWSHGPTGSCLLVAYAVDAAQGIICTSRKEVLLRPCPSQELGPSFVCRQINSLVCSECLVTSRFTFGDRGVGHRCYTLNLQGSSESF